MCEVQRHGHSMSRAANMLPVRSGFNLHSVKWPPGGKPIKSEKLHRSSYLCFSIGKHFPIDFTVSISSFTYLKLNYCYFLNGGPILSNKTGCAARSVFSVSLSQKPNLSTTKWQTRHFKLIGEVTMATFVFCT